ncbi:MAG: S8 family serine peptidase [Gaiellaceae bacterium]
MRTRQAPSSALVALVALIVLLGAAGARGQSLSATSIDEAGWQGVLGGRAPVSTAQRHVVLLRSPSLADRVRDAGGRASERQMRSWNASVVRLQEQFLARFAATGVRLTPEFRYTRVVNGFSARLDGTALARLDRDQEVSGVYPVRIAFPAQVSESVAVAPSAITSLGVPGLDGSGVTVAVLDTGVDATHPYLQGSVLPGIDLLNPGSGGIAQPHPTTPGRPERHGTEVAGIVAGSDGPGGLQGVAPGASILPIRVGGWQPDAEGGFAVYSRTDQLLAGLEAAVDPDGDGDCSDAARVALVGMVEPYASFPEGPLGRAVAGATGLDMLVVVPAGNDGRAGPGFGSIAGPGGAPEAVTVGASDARPATPTVRVQIRASLRVLLEGALPLGGAPTRTVTAPVTTVTRPAASRGISGLFDADGVSTVAGFAALLPRGALSDEAVAEATIAGASAVLVDGALPAGAFSLDVPRGVPVVGLPDAVVKEVRALLAAGVPITVAVGAVDLVPNVGGGSLAAFSSRGLAFGSVLKPELVASGVAIPTSVPGRGADGEVRYGTVSGTSAAAAITAGAAAVLAQGRPAVDAVGLRGLLVGSARRTDLDPTASGAGLLDLRHAVQQEVVADPAVLSFGAPAAGASALERTVRVTNVSTRQLEVGVESVALAPKGVEITIDPQRLRLRPGRTGTFVVRAETRELSDQAGAATGELVVRPAGSDEVHLPWVVSAPERGVKLLSQVSLRRTGTRVSDATPVVLSLVAGSVAGDPDPQIRPLEILEVQLWRGETLLGTLARRREVLPGRYTFGLTGRNADGERLARGTYVIRVVARPGDGTRRQVVNVPYRVR